MKFEITREPFLAGISKVIGATGGGKYIPILNNILLQADTGKITLTATDVEIEIKTSIPATIEDVGTTTIDARKLLQIVRALPGESPMVVQTNGDKATIKSGKSRFTVATLPAQDYPAREDYFTTPVQVKPDWLAGILASASVAMATQDVRPYLNGVLMESKDGKLIAVGTNGHMLSTREITMDAGIDRQAIAPRKFIIEAINALKGAGNDDVLLNFGDGSIQIVVGDTTLSSRLIEGMYPDYNRVIPKDTPYSFTADRAAMIAAVTRANILSNIEFRGLKFALADNILVISGKNTEGETGNDSIAVEYGGPDMEFQLNANYVKAALDAMQSESITVKFANADSSFLWTYGDGVQERHVIMPMRI